MKKTETLLTQFWVISYKSSELKFDEKDKNYIGVVLGNNLQNW